MKTLREMDRNELEILSYQIVGEQLCRDNRKLFIAVAKEFECGRIAAIKLLRGATGKGLKESKAIVKYWEEREGWKVINRPEVFNILPNVTRTL